jgi:hypothetical protein
MNKKTKIECRKMDFDFTVVNVIMDVKRMIFEKVRSELWKLEDIEGNAIRNQYNEDYWKGQREAFRIVMKMLEEDKK